MNNSTRSLTERFNNRLMLQSKFDYHADLANQADQNKNMTDMVIEDARAELALNYLLRS